MAQQRIQYTAGARCQDKRRVAKGQFKRIQREGPTHIPVTRGHASTKCADSSGDRSKWDSDDATDERVSLLPDFVGAYQRYTCRLRAVSDAQRQKLLRGGDIERSPSPIAALQMTVPSLTPAKLATITAQGADMIAIQETRKSSEQIASNAYWRVCAPCTNTYPQGRCCSGAGEEKPPLQAYAPHHSST
ncbi:putative Endonuclease-reverse transcriptase [Trypanosoma cruzi]|uniref:Putative Endonuclease-reverse transcriptase n=1 Tax=Trypanosoma cruzi TaxID=5693 RepID=A0A2V2W5P2_TRYCR|nr:putative Endonuclease-reverse transcriptase [Trypanosoma cruzi]PWV03978.1 putative Endonuclease-reverse transcriptase [Trypanosoma cruzi]PWV03982.1 putative Endonuclease-reverse transcriptase [Trypanosoma cruzi]PWV07979.1 putative Endonuclease-reverse transcriptase [Trypanosoma cruzi]PWV07983.1 putative Endonuclease-reverse transcriptase [Trypanosoma cruzi]